MKASLQLRFSQHLALTPQLQQSIRLLQLSTQELNQELEQIIADNPLLERTDDLLNDSIRLDSGGSVVPAHEFAQTPSSGEASATARDDTGDASPVDDDRDDGSREAEWGDVFSRPGGNVTDDDEHSRQQIATTGRTLREHLRAQLAGTHASPIDRTLVEILIDNLDDDGRLDASLEEIAAGLPELPGIDPDAVSAALKLLQSFDPPGVGARSLSECLLLQLDAHVESASSVDRAVVETARDIARDHLELLAARDFTRRWCGLSGRHQEKAAEQRCTQPHRRGARGQEPGPAALSRRRVEAERSHGQGGSDGGMDETIGTPRAARVHRRSPVRVSRGRR